MAPLPAFNMLSGTSNGVIIVEMSLAGMLGSKYSHCHRPKHQSLCDGLKQRDRVRELESKYMSKSCKIKQVCGGLILSLAGIACTHKQAQGDEIEGDLTTEVVTAGQEQDEHGHCHPVSQIDCIVNNKY